MKKKAFLLLPTLALIFGAFSFANNKVDSHVAAADELPEVTATDFALRAGSDNPSSGTTGYTFNLYVNDTNGATLHQYSEVTHTLLDVNDGIYVDYSVQVGAYENNKRFIVSFPGYQSMTENHYYYLSIPKGTVLGGTVKLANEVSVYFRHRSTSPTEIETPINTSMGTKVETTASAKKNSCSVDVEGYWYFNVDEADYNDGYTTDGGYFNIGGQSNFKAGEYTYLNHILFAEEKDGPWVPYIAVCGQNHVNAAIYLRQGGGNDIRMSIAPDYYAHTKGYQYVKIEAGCTFPSWSYIKGRTTDKIQYVTSEDAYFANSGESSLGSSFMPYAENGTKSTVFDSTTIAGGWNGKSTGTGLLAVVLNFQPTDGSKAFAASSSSLNWAANLSDYLLFNGQPAYKTDGIFFNYQHGNTYGQLLVKPELLVTSNGYELPTFEFKAGGYFVGQYLGNMTITYDSSKAEDARFQIVSQSSCTSNITADNEKGAQNIYKGETYSRVLLQVNYGSEDASPTGHFGFTDVYIKKVGGETETAYQGIFYVNNQILIDNWIALGDHSSQVGIYTATIKAGSSYGVASGVKALVPTDVVLYVYIGSTYSWTVNADDYSALEAFVADGMHMGDYSESLGYCSDSTHHYYATAKELLAELNTFNPIDFQIFMWCEAYNDVLVRLQAWALANGEILTPINGTFTAISSSNNLMIFNNTSHILPIVILVSLASVAGLYLILKRKKEN